MIAVLGDVIPAAREMPLPHRVFLSAEWRDLVMLNYEVDPQILSRYIPPGTTLDSFQGRTYLSLVGFRFCNTRLFGSFPVPFHTDFEEVNLRFYVRREAGGEERRGVVFIAEVVPKRAIAITARLVYGENYIYRPMRHRIEAEGFHKKIEYQWKVGRRWCSLAADVADAPSAFEKGSLEQFITEHYWGYSTRRIGGCLEYHVSHVPWQVWPATNAKFEGDVKAFYGREFGSILEGRPASAFVADGSPVVVYAGDRVQ